MDGLPATTPQTQAIAKNSHGASRATCGKIDLQAKTFALLGFFRARMTSGFR